MNQTTLIVLLVVGYLVLSKPQNNLGNDLASAFSGFGNSETSTS